MKKIFSVLLVISICACASAQSFRTGYFLDNYTYGYRINPAATTGESFLGLAVGNIDLQNSSTIGISSFLFPKGNTLVTGLNSSVDANTFLGGLSKTNGMYLNESINLLSLGLSNGERTFIIELNARTEANISLPYDLFAFLKKGGVNRTYNIGDIYSDINAIADLSFGYSRKINDKFSVGARIHALLGAARINVMGNGTSISMNEQNLTINADLDMTSAGILKLGLEGDSDQRTPTLDTGSSLGGFGATVDLGAVYKPIDGLEVSFSVNDLGGISWKNNATLKASGKSSFEGGSIQIDGGNVTTDLDKALDEVTGSLNFKELGETSKFEFLPMTIAAGARYRMPFYEGLSAGLLATYHTGKYTSWYDVRVGATITPARIISATANLGMTTFGPSFGAAINAHLGPVNLILGLDSYIGKMAKLQGINVPLNKFQENIHFGLAFSF